MPSPATSHCAELHKAQNGECDPDLEEHSRAASIVDGVEEVAALPRLIGTKAAIREGLSSLKLSGKVASGVRRALSSGRTDAAMVEATSDGGANVYRWVKGDNEVSSTMYHYVIDNKGKIVGSDKQAYDKAGAIAGTQKSY